MRKERSMIKKMTQLVGLNILLVAALVGCEKKQEAEQNNSSTETTQGEATVNNPLVKVDTNLGSFVIELDEQKAPITVKNFLNYVNEGYYSETLFHRVIPGFMVQGGGFTTDFVQKTTKAPIQNEANNGLHNLRGTVAMARTSDPNSASAQFFINVADNSFLDYTSPTPQGWGYAVFGRVVEGMDIVDAISKQKTGTRAGHADVPTNNVVIQSIQVVELPNPNQ